MNNCARYWAYSNELPIDEVVTYWCEKSGFNAHHCKDAKRAAIIQYCKDGVIKYGRSDGKNFPDSVDMLAAWGVLTIERDSFDAWVTENFEDESPLPDKPLSSIDEMNTTKALALMAWILSENKPAMQIGGKPNAAQIGDAVATMARKAFGDDVRGFDSFNKKISKAVQLLAVEVKSKKPF